MSWEYAKIGDYVEVISGPAFKSARFTVDCSDVPLVKGENIGQGKILWEKSKYWPRSDLDTYERYMLEPGDIVLAMDRPWVPAGLKWASIQPYDPVSLLVQRVARLRAQKGLRQGFLRYVVASSGFTKYINNIMYGVNVPHISGKQIRAFSFRLPSEAKQQRIADILSAYDDLIENNRRRIKLLEEAARQLYREWFVRLRFPGHEHTKIIDGIPEGWDLVPLKESTTKIGSGATPRGGAAAYEASGITLIRSLNVYDYRFKLSGLAFINDIQAAALSNVAVRKRDVLLNITGASVGRCCMAPSRHLPARVNQHVMIIRAEPHEASPIFLLYSINSERNKELLMSIARAGGATREALTKDVVSDFEILRPPRQLQEEFDDLAGIGFAEQELLAAQNEQLAKARDLLLPRLMDGRIAV